MFSPLLKLQQFGLTFDLLHDENRFSPVAKDGANFDSPLRLLILNFYKLNTENSTHKQTYHHHHQSYCLF
jgi:hypothetical protein